MTDSLAMKGILGQCSSIEEGVLKSLEAGHDLILLGGKQLITFQNGLEFTAADVKRIRDYIVDAVKQGRLSEKRLDTAVARLLALKQKYGLFDVPIGEDSFLNTQINTIAHRFLAKQIAERALQLVRGQDSLPLSFQSTPLLIVAPDCLQDEISQTSWNALGPHVKIVYFKGLNPDQATIQEIKVAAAKAKQCLYFAYNAWQFAGQQDLFQLLIKSFSFTVALAVCDPLDVDYLTEADIVLCTFSPVACSLQAAFDYLTEKH